MFRSVKYEKLNNSDSDSEGTSNWKKETEKQFEIERQKDKTDKELKEKEELAKQMDIAREKQRKSNQK